LFDFYYQGEAMSIILPSEQIANIIQEAIKNKTPVKLRNGSKAFVTHDSRNFDIRYTVFPISGRDVNNKEIEWTPFGYYGNTSCLSPLDIVGEWVEPHPLEAMPVDHPVYVRDSEDQRWIAGHFSNLLQDSVYPIRVYLSGETSFTSKMDEGWKEYRLPTAGELKGTAWEGSRFVAEQE
jgi:hypothetical protein